ncbi:hypothetical protein N7468_007328 [Penicillium chermesinum]|uniref:LUC7-domain-containing protein n=1 Tax=Penicillium chermesinum TaxID=63820 RepID=A0A9W9NWA4_9EURO|nr:uncharacterized protein N7468_007328 [Penicillium chermesinum]KAJ5226103.1 hypothetical protein N7468_007328 [Penicillium chermesinum]
MAAEQRRLLEQLMGLPRAATRNFPLPMTKSVVPTLLALAPHDLFTNTRQDSGACPKVHNEGLKAQYENATPAEKAKWGFEFDYMRDIQGYILEVDKRIHSSQRNLEQTPQEIKETQNLIKQIHDLNDTINNGLLEVCILGELGDVAMAITELHKVRAAKLQKEIFERDLKNLQDTGGPSGHQKLQVCDVCGAYLSRLDNDRRLADHFYGKMHMGYTFMRDAFNKLSAELNGRERPVRHVEDDPYSAGGRAGGRNRYGGGGGGGGRGGGHRRRPRW